MRKNTITRSRNAYFRLRKSTKARLAAARKKWADACRPLILRAKTAEAAEAAFRAAPSGTAAKLLALTKWAGLCADPPELSRAYFISRPRFFSDNPVLRRWRGVSRNEVDAAKTVKEAERAFIRAPHWNLEEMDSYVSKKPLTKDYALRKLYFLCTTIEELQLYQKRHIRDLNNPGESKRIYEERYAAIRSGQPTG